MDPSSLVLFLHFRKIIVTPPFRTHRPAEVNEEVEWPRLKYTEFLYSEMTTN